MAINPKDGALLYHLTPFDNLEGIIMNGLHPRKNLNNFKDIADSDILDDREKYDLQEYVPFHFFAGSPFAGATQKHYPEIEFIYITIKRIYAVSDNFVIVPSHPLHYKQELLPWKEGIEMIDWDTMVQRDYSNANCKQVCMAEALYKGIIDIKYFHCIYTKSSSTQSKVKALFVKHNCENIAHVNVNENFFVKHD